MTNSRLSPSKREYVSSDERREKILDAAEELIVDEGRMDFALNTVIARSGGSRRTIYEAFGNKEGLLEAVVLRRIQDVQAVFSELAATGFHEATPRQLLRGIAIRFLSHLVEPRTLRLFRMVIASLNEKPELGVQMLKYGPDRVAELLAGYFERLNGQGICKIESPEDAVWQLLEMVKGPLHLRALVNPELRYTAKDIELHIDKVLQAFTRIYPGDWDYTPELN